MSFQEQLMVFLDQLEWLNKSVKAALIEESKKHGT